MQEPVIYWEDFWIGEVAEHGTYHVTRDEMLEFAREFDPQDNHIDEDAAKKSLLGGLSASGWHTASMALRLVHDGLSLNSAFVGSAGVDELRWQRPVYADDVLTVRRVCKDSRPSQSRPNTGLIYFLWEVLNQRREIVMTMASWGAYRCRAQRQ